MDDQPEQPAGISDRFRLAAQRLAQVLGSWPALVAAVGLVALWAASGPLFRFSDTWQLVINTTTTVATFLMVFVIQNTTNRSADATQLKLDELIRAVHDARIDFLGVDDESDESLEQRRREFRRLAAAGKDRAGSGAGNDTKSPAINGMKNPAGDRDRG